MTRLSVLVLLVAAALGCAVTPNPTGRLACNARVVLAIDASSRSCTNAETIRSSTKAFFAGLQGTGVSVSLFSFAGPCTNNGCVASSQIVIPYTTVNAGTLTLVNTYLDTMYLPCAQSTFQSWAQPFDVLFSQYTSTLPDDFILLTPALSGPNYPGCTNNATNCVAANNAACSAASFPKISGVHVFPVAVGDVAAPGLNALQSISGNVQWDEKLGTLATSDYAVQQLSATSRTMESIAAALCCRGGVISVDARISRQCVLPSNNLPSSVQNFFLRFTPANSVWLTSFKIAANGGNTNFAPSVVCDLWTNQGDGSFGGNSVFLTGGATYQIPCRWTPAFGNIADGYSLTLSNAATTQCTVTSSTPSTTPVFNVRASCVTSDCRAPNSNLNPQCGLRVMLIVDDSNSICDTGAVSTTRDAFRVFVNALNTGPLSNITNLLAVVQFDLVGTIITPTYVPVNDFTIATVFEPYINNTFDPCRASSLTAWGNGLDAAYDFVTVNSNIAPDLILMITDGEPNVPADAALPVACQAANRVKSLGSHIFVVGVGNALSNTVAISTISGPDQWLGNPATFPQADFQTLPLFTDLASALRQIVIAFCCPNPAAIVSPSISVFSPCSSGSPTVTLLASSAPNSSVGAVSILLTDQGSLVNRNNLLTCNPGLTGNVINFGGPRALSGSPSQLAVCTIAVSQLTPFTLRFNSFDGVPPVCRPDLGTPSSFDFSATPPSLSITLNSTTSASCGASNGSIRLNVVGGQAPYTYLWSNGQTSAQLTNVGAGVYSVNVTDSTGCSGSLSGLVVGQTGGPSVALAGINNVACFGASTGRVNITVSGGTAPYTYLWNTGAITQNINSVPAGSYNVTVTDVNGCTASAGPFVVTQPTSAVAVSTTKTNVACFGGSTGSITAVATGGTPPYSYLWSNSASTQNISNLPVGSYSVQVRDSLNCLVTSPAVQITQPALALSVSLASSSPVSCFGGSNGAISIDVAGGTSPYTFQWSNGAISQNLNSVPAGSYTVNVTDANGCRTSGVFQVTQPSAALNVVLASLTNVSCAGGSGSVRIAVFGGTAPYSYLWSNGATTQNLTNVPTGTYSVVVTDANGCTASSSTFVVSSPSSPLAIASSSISNVGCRGASSGAINITVSGGTAPYTYLWTNGATTANIAGLVAGTYNVTVTDANGCTLVSSFVVTQPAGFIGVTVAVVSPVSCFGGSNGAITIIVTGGTAPYTYLWNNNATTQNLTGVPAGSYFVVVTDANSCQTSSQPSLITQPNAPLNGIITSTPTSCAVGSTTGTASITVSGGTAPYSYLWSTGATTATISNLAVGGYGIVVTDANGCTFVGTASVGQTSAITVNGGVTQNVTCFGASTGAITVSASGGVPPYTYSWSNGQTGPVISNLVAGVYTVTVSDQAPVACQQVRVFQITQPAAALAVTATASAVRCNGGNSGSISTSVTGGTGPYTYLWNNGATTSSISGLTAGTYSVTVTDANGCTTNSGSIVVSQPANALAVTATASAVRCNGGNSGSISTSVTGGTGPYTYLWNNGATTSSISGLTAGTYSVTVTDANGCTTNSGSIVVSQPATALTGSLSSTATSCTAGSTTGTASVTASGGTAPYSYLWNNGATTATISNLAAATYSVTVTDANGCTFVGSVSVPSTSAIVINGGVTQNVACFGASTGMISVSASGGLPPYTYSWSNGQTGPVISNLAAGFYTVTVRDSSAVACQQVRVFQITQPAAALAVTATASAVRCNGGNSGSISTSVTGGTGPYTYLWNNGATTSSISGLTAGTYSVTVTDANGCTTNSGSIVVSQPATALTGSLSSTATSCTAGSTTGTASVTASGGTAPYSYLWNNGATTATISNLAAATYSVTVTDANGCTFVGSVSVPSTSAIVINGGVTQNVACFGASTGAITVSASGGVPPYTYSWSNGQTGPVISNLAAGFYTVTVRDSSAVACQQVRVFQITQPAAALTVTATATNSNCPSSTGTVSAFVSGGVVPYTYLWSNGATSQTISNVANGTYTVSVRDANNCGPVTASATVGCNANLRITCPSNRNQQCPADYSPYAQGGLPTFTGCESASMSYTDSFAAGCGNTGTITRLWTAIGCNQAVSCTQTLTTFDTIQPQIFPLVQGGLNNVTVQCLSQVEAVPIPAVRATDNCQDSNVLLPCNCCHLCRTSDLFPCCSCERAKRIEFALTPLNCNTPGNSDETCRQGSGFSTTAGNFQVQISNPFTGFVYYSGAVPASGTIVINSNVSIVRLAYSITSGGLDSTQQGHIETSCKTFKRGEVYGSLQVVGMFPGSSCDIIQPCPCCDQCQAVTVVKRVSTVAKCLGRRCGLTSKGPDDSECCPGSSCRLGAMGYSCQTKTRGVQAREGARVSLSLSKIPLQNGEERVFTANDLCGNIATAAQYVTATNLNCKRDEDL